MHVQWVCSRAENSTVQLKAINKTGIHTVSILWKAKMFCTLSKPVPWLIRHIYPTKTGQHFAQTSILGRYYKASVLQEKWSVYCLNQYPRPIQQILICPTRTGQYWVHTSTLADRHLFYTELGCTAVQQKLGRTKFKPMPLADRCICPTKMGQYWVQTSTLADKTICSTKAGQYSPSQYVFMADKHLSAEFKPVCWLVDIHLTKNWAVQASKPVPPLEDKTGQYKVQTSSWELQVMLTSLS